MRTVYGAGWGYAASLRVNLSASSLPAWAKANSLLMGSQRPSAGREGARLWVGLY
jgi:hypothetical protein